MTTTIEHALGYAARGWRVVPLHPGRKYPCIEAWQDRASTDPAQLAAWFAEYPAAGVGIATGERSGIFVLDVDTAEGKVGAESLATLEHEHGPLPDTVEAVTGGGGRHLYFRHPPGLDLSNSASRLGPGLDIRANGGQVVAAPTVHPDTGQPYAWNLEQHPDLVKVADAPAWLLKLLEPPPKIDTGPRGTFETARLAWDRFNYHDDVADFVAGLLVDAGWTEGRPDRDGARYFTRPGKSHGIGASLGKVAPGVLFCFTSSAPPLEAERSYDPADLLALLRFDGDRAATDAELVRQGWGIASRSVPADERLTTGEAATPAAAPAPQGFYVDWPTFLAVQPDEAERWLLEPILAKSRGHVLYAPHKVGKSLLTLWAALELATGDGDVRVIYLDYEMGDDDLRERVTDMGYGPGHDLGRLRYALLPSLPSLDTAEGGAALATLVDAERAAWPDAHVVVIIDTTGRAVEGEENSADTIRAFYRHSGMALKQRGVTWARLDHAGKDKTKGQRGSSAKGDDVDVVWSLSADDAGALTLKRDAARMGWVPETVKLGRTDDPLRYSTDAKSYRHGTRECAAHLDELGVDPLACTVRDAEAALKGAGKGKGRSIVTDAVRFRKEQAMSGRITSDPSPAF